MDRRKLGTFLFKPERREEAIETCLYTHADSLTTATAIYTFHFQRTEGSVQTRPREEEKEKKKEIILIKRCPLTRVKLIAVYKHDKNHINIHFNFRTLNIVAYHYLQF